MGFETRNDPNATTPPARNPSNVPGMPGTPGGRPQQGGTGRTGETKKPAGKDSTGEMEDAGGGRKPAGSDSARPGGSSTSNDPFGRSKPGGMEPASDSADVDADEQT